jgi:hypothetical protein
MRRILTTSLCALCLAFGSVAGLAHVHGAAGHDEQSHGLHLDHAHLDHHGDRDHDDSPPDRDDVDLAVHSRDLDHDTGDAVYLSGPALRLLPGVRVLSAIVSVRSTIERPTLSAQTERERPNHPRAPPEKIPSRPRAPPV